MRYLSKQESAKVFPVAIATMNFLHDENVAFVARSAACFGAESVHVIGRMPEPNDLRRLSGGNSLFVDFKQYSNTVDFIQYCRNNNYCLISIELNDRAESLYDIDFPVDRPTMIVVGHETYGVPEDVMHRSEKIVYIPMPGVGYVLNTSQAATVVLSEYVRRFAK